MDVSVFKHYPKGSLPWSDWAFSLPNVEAYVVSAEDLEDMRNTLRNYFDGYAILVTGDRRGVIRDKRADELPWEDLVRRGEVVGLLMGRPVVAGSQTAVCTKHPN